MFKKFRQFINPNSPKLDENHLVEKIDGTNYNKHTFDKNEFAVCVLPKRYTKVGQCGEGSYGYVFNAKDQVTGEHVAIKKITKDSDSSNDPKDIIRFCRELKILSLLKHKNIIGFHGAFTPSQDTSTFHEMYLVMPFCGLTLRALIVSETRFIHEEIAYLSHQALCGLQYLHQMGIIHRDLKPDNIALDLDTKVVKIIDFGMSSMENAVIKTRSGIGTLCYNSPEITFNANYDSKTDIFSLGCTIYELFSKRILVYYRPRKDNAGNDIEHMLEMLRLFGTPDITFMNQIQNEHAINWINEQEQFLAANWCQLLPNNIFPDREDSNVPLTAQNARNLLQNLLCFNAAERFNADQALEHSYFTSCHENKYDLNNEQQGERTLADWEDILFKEVKQCEGDYKIF
ncbi:Stress-activated protein kinase JNK [Aphelenchoides bicaudatus]|nr:Stress-activated protein kinase JNK [Aphelenchoides bicaudatus]